jgi:hypothetical protein
VTSLALTRRGGYDERGRRIFSNGMYDALRAQHAIFDCRRPRDRADHVRLLLGAEVRFDGGFLVALGITSAVALQHAGHGPCGTDTCDAWMTPGDLLLVGRVGVGYAF